MKAIFHLLLLGLPSRFNCCVEALVPPESPINRPAHALTAATPRSNTSLGSDLNNDPPDEWYVFVDPAPAPRIAFRQKDVYLGAIAALTVLAQEEWYSPLHNAVYFEPAFPSPLRIYINVVTGIVTPVANAVWTIWETLLYYSEHPDTRFQEVDFSTYERNIRILKGGWLSSGRPTPPPAPSLPGAVNSSSVESSLVSLEGDAPNIGLVILDTASFGPPSSLSNVSTVRTTLKIGELVLEFHFDGEAPRLTPQSVYLALAFLLEQMAPRPNTNRVVTYLVTDPDQLTQVKLVRHAADRRGRGLFLYRQAKGIPRALAAVLTHAAAFGTGYVDVYTVEGHVLLATLSLEKGPRWQPQSVADVDDEVDVS